MKTEYALNRIKLNLMGKHMLKLKVFLWFTVNVKSMNQYAKGKKYANDKKYAKVKKVR